MDNCEVLRNYFQAWLENNIEVVKHTFSEDVIYSECYGPEYRGLQQILKWFTDWNQHGQVLEWSIKRIFQQDNTVVAEWYFKCDYDHNIDGFDGVTIADFDQNGKIMKLCEFQSKVEHYYPYSE